MRFSQDNSFIYFSPKDDSGLGFICKSELSNLDEFVCLKIPEYDYSTDMLQINFLNFYYVSESLSSGQRLISSIDFDQKLSNWAYSMTCSSSCYFRTSNSYLKDNILYSCIADYSAINIIKLNATSGDILSSIQKYSRVQVHIYSLTQNDTYIYITIRKSSVSEVLRYHMETGQMEVYKFNSAVIIAINVQPDKERMILAGRLNSILYIAWSRYIYTLTDTDYNLQTYTSFSATEVGLQITTPTIQTSYVTGTYQEVIYPEYNFNSNQRIYNYTSDVFHWYETFETTVMSNWNATINATLTCSMSGLTNLTYSIQAYSNYTIPDWVQINQENSQIIVTTPNVTTDTIFGFSITTSGTNITGPSDIPVLLNVLACKIDN